MYFIAGTPPPSLRRRSSTDTSGEVIKYGENEISWDAATSFGGGQSQPQTYGSAEGHFFSFVAKLVVFDLSKKTWDALDAIDTKIDDLIFCDKSNATIHRKIPKYIGKYQNSQYFMLHNVAKIYSSRNT